MVDIREQFTKNAKEFDGLMVKMLGENEDLRLALMDLIIQVKRIYKELPTGQDNRLSKAIHDAEKLL